MTDFYLRAKKSFFGGDHLRIQYFEGSFYEVERVIGSRTMVVNGGSVIGFEDGEVDQRFDRIEGSFIDLVANRPLFIALGTQIASDVVRYGLRMRDTDEYMAFIVKVQDGLKRFFNDSRCPQPSTSLAGWKFTIIANGEPCHFLKDLILEHCQTTGLENPGKAFITVEVEFESDNDFLYKQSVTKSLTTRFSAASV